MTFNPKVKDFLKEKEDITVIGLFWSGYWRLAVCVMAGYAVILFLMFLAALAGEL